MRRGLAAIVAVGVIVGFGYLYGYSMKLTWSGSPNLQATISHDFVYVATALAGLVGGVVAMIFNEKLPDAGSSVAGQAPPVAAATPSASGPKAAFAAVRGSLSLGERFDILEFASLLYVAIYFLAGTAAIVTWLKFGDKTPELIKNLALIWSGLAIAISRSLWDVQKKLS